MNDITRNSLIKRISVAGKKEFADTVIKNGKIIDVFNLEIMEGDIAIADGMIVGIGDYEGHEIIDAKGQYICPAFIDGHVHLESSMITANEYSKVTLPHGVTTVITDPHEIANVSGTDGISFMLESSENLPLDIFVMLPSCVPATSFENAGSTLHATDLEPFFSHERVLGLAEVMDFPAVMNCHDEMMNKLLTTLHYTDKIDGHGAGFHSDHINIYRAAGIRTDHECISAEEAKERVQRGMYVMIRQGSAAKNLANIISVVNERNARQFLFCTDDKHLDELIIEGSIDHNVRLAIQHGCDPLLAISLGSLNAAQCYHLSTKGAIAPGYEADLLFLKNLENIEITSVFKKGKLVANNGISVWDDTSIIHPKKELLETIQIPKISAQQLQIPLNENNLAYVIGTIANQIVTEKLIEEVDSADGYFLPSVEKDLAKLVVIERHKGKGTIGLGIVKGLGLTAGAIASTVAHDSHNLIVAGMSDDDILAAIQAIEEMNGGLAVIQHEKVIGNLSLQISGLMSTKGYETVNEELHQLHEALERISTNCSFNIFQTLSFLSLPVIPHLKLTDIGLFDVDHFKHINVRIEI